MTLRTLRAEFLVENLDLEAATGVEGARWEYFQLAHLNDDSPFRIERKSRQIAWSWLSAAEAVAEGILERQSSIFVSINLDEATEKIRYARSVMEALNPKYRPPLKRDNETTLQFSNGARLISLAARPPRGKARFNVYLDEFAHVQRDREIYKGAVPIISKGGRLRTGSSTLGASGLFWEIDTQSMQTYPDYTRKCTPWWETYAFSLNPVEARKLASAMDTFQRVEMFGNDRIKVIYANVPEEDFQQEYEGEYVDETTAWIPWEEIQAVQDRVLKCATVTCKGLLISPALDLITKVRQWSDSGLIETVLAGGMDIGRTRNTTEMYLVGLSTVGSFPLRVAITLDQCPFDEQFEVVTAALTYLPLKKFLIDHNGIGRNLAENAERDFPTKAQGVDFTNATKSLWATDTKMLVQQRKTPIPVDRDLAYQIHSIKKTVTAAKNLVFDTGRNEKHHADKFWAWALALHAAGIPVAKKVALPQSYSYSSY